MYYLGRWSRLLRPIPKIGVASQQQAATARRSLSTTARRSLSATQSEHHVHHVQVRPPPAMMSSLLDIGSRRIFTTDHDLFRESVRKFVTEELVPAQASFEAQGQPSREIWEKMGAFGLLGVAIPAEVGGVGGTFKDEAIVSEEMSYGNVWVPAKDVHGTMVMPYIRHYGTKHQQDRYIPDMAKGKCIGAIAMTEPDAGSDLQGIRTRAVQDGSDYILNGSKTFITNGWLADVCIVVAVTDPTARSTAHGITLFLVDTAAPGFHKGKKLKKLGWKGQDTAELFLEDVRVPGSAVLGGNNKGFYRLMEQLPQERLILAVQCAAHAEWMFEETRRYVRMRKAFGSTLSNLGTVQHKLAEMKTQVALCRSFMDECIELHQVGKLDGEMASMAKYWASDLLNQLAKDCVQLHGGSGFIWDTPIARAYADVRVHTIHGGTNQIMKNLIARNIVNDKHAGKA